MKIAHIRHALAKALDDFKGGEASATHVLSAIEALIEEKNALQQERPSFADWTSDYVRDNLHKLKPQPAQQDIPDLIAGTLGVSRGTAYDLMREALAEQPAQRNPLTDANKQFNAVIDFAITQGSQASMFLRHWREGDTAEWPEFDAYLAAHGITGEQA